VTESRNRALEQTRRLIEAQQQEAQAEENAWRALAVEVRGAPVILPIKDVSELAVCENITPVPLTRPWVRGLTNVRGQLYTVVDLSVFLGGPETRLSRDARIIMLGDNGLESCFLVNNVLGLKIVRDDMRVDIPDTLDENLVRYCSGGVALDEKVWSILDIASITADPRYVNPGRLTERREALGRA
jgi:twitching motility protein PilI